MVSVTIKKICVLSQGCYCVQYGTFVHMCVLVGPLGTYIFCLFAEIVVIRIRNNENIHDILYIIILIICGWPVFNP